MVLLFLIRGTPGLSFGPRYRRKQAVCQRTPPTANINETSNSEREDEIAAKIASLRKMKRLKSQRGSSDSEDPTSPENKDNAVMISSFEDLPDWKKEEVLQGQIQEAEAFFKKGSGVVAPSPTSATDEDYKPKVSTWGVFPRPDNISKTFGGGKKIKEGGVDLNSDESKKKDEAIAKKLAAYRSARGIDTEREEKHREEIEEALEKAKTLSSRSSPYEAIRTLESVQEYVSDRSRLGGQVFLSLALAYEAVGKREEARELYVRLRRSPFPEVSGKARQLLQGFAAMEMLKIEDETRQRGFRVTDFLLPNVSDGIERRYETAVSSDKTEKSRPLDAKTSLLLLLLIAGPVAVVFLVRAASGL